MIDFDFGFHLYQKICTKTEWYKFSGTNELNRQFHIVNWFKKNLMELNSTSFRIFEDSRTFLFLSKLNY